MIGHAVITNGTSVRIDQITGAAAAAAAAVKPRWDGAEHEQGQMGLHEPARAHVAQASLRLSISEFWAKRKGARYLARSMLLLPCTAPCLHSDTNETNCEGKRERPREGRGGGEACTHLKFAIQHYSAPASRLPSILPSSSPTPAAAPVLTCKNDTIDTRERERERERETGAHRNG